MGAGAPQAVPPCSHYAHSLCPPIPPTPQVEKLQSLGFWKPDDLDQAAARAHLAYLNGTLRTAGGASPPHLLNGWRALGAAVVLLPAGLLLAAKRRRPPIKLF